MSDQRSASDRSSAACRVARPEVLRVFVLGRFRVIRGRLELRPEQWKLQRAASVLQYLASEGGQWVSADLLAEVFWPDMDPDRARNSLRVAVHALRRALEPKAGAKVSAYVETRQGRYRLRTEAPVMCDMQEFLRMSAEGRALAETGKQEAAARRLAGALALYGGDFLAEDRYEEWAILVREHLRHEYLETLRALARLERSRPGGAQRIIPGLRRAVAQAPEREDLQRELMWHLAASGCTAEAIAQYQRLERFLRTEFGVEPAPQTKALYAQVRQSAAPTGPPAATTGAGASPRDSFEPPPVPDGESPSPGALIVDWSTFRRLVTVERSRLQRWQMPISLIALQGAARPVEPATTWDGIELMVSAGGSAAASPVPWQKEAAAHLRRGDLACALDPGRLLVLLPHAGPDQASRVSERLMRLSAMASEHALGGPLSSTVVSLTEDGRR